MAKNKHDKLFPPHPDHQHEWEALETIIACMVDGRKADYLSTPMTTGKRFIEWYQVDGRNLDSTSNDYRRGLEINVINPNSLHAKKFVQCLRAEHRIVIEPTSFYLNHWTQNDYRHLWGRIIERFIKRIWLLNGWEYSSGCSFEFYIATKYGLETLNEGGEFITRKKGMAKINGAISEMNALKIDTSFLQEVLNHLGQLNNESVSVHFKDVALDELAISANVAQFVSFGPGSHPEQRFSHVIGTPPNFFFESVEESVETLLQESPEGTVNVRSFKPDDPANHPFKMGLKSVKDVSSLVKQLARQNLYTIVNETIDISDGGVSGVLMGHVVEFSPDDTPRCVEKPGTARLPFNNAMHILERVYKFRPSLNYDPDLRVEFSIHPLRRGVRNEHTIIWEIQATQTTQKISDNYNPKFGKWPNNFSRFLGDKAYGLLVADSIGLPVPYTNVISRRIAPFEFGCRTGSGEMWLRTAPKVKEPGHYPTIYGWKDPYELLNEVDIKGDHIPSVLAQESVNSIWSGALNTEKDGPNIQGVRGFADRFMQGQDIAVKLPEYVLKSVREVYHRAMLILGPVSIEWAFDGEKTWVLQLHMELSSSHGDTIVDGNPKIWHRFSIANGLEKLRTLSADLQNKDEGIEIVGRVGITSHVAEVLRKANIPSRIVDEKVEAIGSKRRAK